jgi:hypothetical protein
MERDVDVGSVSSGMWAWACRANGDGVQTG